MLPLFASNKNPGSVDSPGAEHAFVRYRAQGYTGRAMGRGHYALHLSATLIIPLALVVRSVTAFAGAVFTRPITPPDQNVDVAMAALDINRDRFR